MSRKRVPFRLKVLTGAVLVALAPAAFPDPTLVLPPGVLPVFQGVAAGTASVTTIPNLLTVHQSSQSAILDWSSFNVAGGAEVRFIQPNAGASALNRIHQADPSVIQGRVTANGQVYLVNQNGILFDQGSRINVGTLLASTLRMPEDVYLAGLNAARTSPALEAEVLGRSTGIDLRGTINVSAGGSVLVFAPRVTNTGTISAPDGQVILAAGERVWLAANSPQDLTLRGLLVEFQAGAGEVNLASVVTNQGVIDAPRGNVTLAALAVNQQNRVSASTAVLQNGSVWLSSKEKDTGRRGTVNLGKGSFTGTPLDTTDTTTLAEDQDYSRYRAIVRVEAKELISRGRVESPGGIVTIDVRDAEQPGKGRVFLDTDSVLTAAGSWADLSMSKNLLSVLLTSNELKDAPVQKGGALQGERVTIDIRKGTSLFDESGFVGAIKRTVAEKAATGGEITIVADGDVIVRPGAQIDVSGGGYRFAEGIVSTSKLLSNGKVYDIGEASADLRYEGILNQYDQEQPRAPTVSYSQFGSITARREAADVQGKNGGTLAISATGGTVIEGSLLGGTTAGRYQLDAGKQPLGATFILGDKTQIGAGVERPDLGQSEIRFSANSNILGANFAVADALPANLVGVATLPLSFFQRSAVGSSGEYRQGGFGTIELYANDRITLGAGQSIRMPAGGAILLGAGQVDVEGSISAPGGAIELRGIPTTGVTSGVPGVKVGGSATLDTRGLWINDSGLAPAGVFTIAGGGTALPRLLDGGRITIGSGDVDLQSGAVLDVTGGGRLLRGNSVVGGKGGQIQVRTGLGKDDEFFLGSFRLDATLLGFGLGGGGSLDIHAGKVRISSTSGTDPSELVLGPTNFTRGFSRYAVAGIDGLTVASGTEVEAIAPTMVLDQLRALSAPTGSDVYALSTINASLPEALRSPASVTLAATGVNAGRLVLETGSILAVDPRGQITLSAAESIEIRGEVRAPAGTIAVDLQGGRPGSLGTGQLVIGREARLLANGRVLAMEDAQGRLIGEVLSGGQVNVTATKSALITEAGSLIDVSAVGGTLDIPRLEFGIPVYRRETLAGAAGSISVRGTSSIVLDGDLRGRAVGGNVGGSFSLELLRNSDLGSEQERRVVVSQTMLTDRMPDASYVDGYVRADTFAAGGIESVRLRSQDVLEFRGDVTLETRRRLVLDAQAIGAAGDGHVDLASAQVTFRASPDDPLLAALTPRPFVPTRDGAGTLTVRAGGANGGVLDLVGDLTLSGFADVRFASQGDLRLSGNLLNAMPDQDNLPDIVRGSLTTTADVTLSAAQIYPTTFTNYTLRLQSLPAAGAQYENVVGSELRILGNGGARGTVLSAGGNLTFAAETIVLDHGVVKAPLGQVTFNATDSVTLDAESIVSVSAKGAIVPYGTTRVGQDWYYAGIPVSAPPVKSISFSAPDVKLNEGAVLDVSGGGEIQAYEFVPGPGGSKDTLAQAGTYAILPWLGSNVAPLDTALLTQTSFLPGTDRSPYDSVYLSGVAGLADGYYALLPGQYALLPGAFVVRPQTDARFRDMTPGRASSLADGTTVVAGHWAVGATGQRDARWSGFAVESPDAARRRSEYQLSDSTFFTRQAANADARSPVVPRDAGRIALEATRTLVLDSTILAAPGTGGRSGAVDISSSAIAIVARGGSGPSGYLTLEAGRLRALDARLLLGGRRDDATGETIVTAGDILVANDASDVLSAPEIILAATNGVTVKAGSVIRGEGTFSGEVDALHVQGNGALLRVSSGEQVALVRGNTVPGAGGVLTVEDGATVAAARSVLFDATSDTRVAGVIDIGSHGSLSIGARQIGLGTTAAVSEGFVLSNEQIAALPELDQLVLRSYQTIDLHGETRLGSTDAAGVARIRELVLDARALSGRPVDGANGVTIVASSVALQNTSGASADAPVMGIGDLRIEARDLTLGAGAKVLDGFGTVTFDVAHEVSGAGTGSLATAGNLAVDAGRFIARTRSDQSVSADGVILRTRPLPGQEVFAAAPIGGRWTITGSSISQGARFDLAAGSLTLVSTHGDLVLESGSRINAGGAAKDFSSTPGAPVVAYAAGGHVELEAQEGQVRVDHDALVDVSGTDGGGDAGSLTIRALGAGGNAALSGTLSGKAIAAARSGMFTLDVNSLASLSDLAAALTGNFGESVNIRVRTGDLSLAAGDTLSARQIRLGADAGNIALAGTLDSSSARNGNRIDVFAGGDLTIAPGSLLDARGLGGGAPGSARDGGTVNLAARDGNLTFAQGATIDISTGTTSGNGGEAIFTAARTGNVVAANLDGTIIGTAGTNGLPARITVVGQRAYGVAQVNAAVVSADSTNPIWNDYQTFVTGVDSAGVLSGLDLVGTDPGRARVVAGIELRSVNDLTVSAAWNLASSAWLSSAQPGVLTLRTAGTLDVRNGIGLPNDNLVAGDTWSVRLVGGADLGAADPRAVRSKSELADRGDVLFSTANSAVRTGTGYIDIAAGRNVELRDKAAVVYTAGAPGFGGGATNQYATGGGDVRVTAQQDIVGPGQPIFVNDWLFRTNARGIGNVTNQPGGWWPNRGTVRQAFATLGGGDLELSAGRDVNQIYALAPTSGRVDVASGTTLLDVQGGGDLYVTAGRNISGGQYLLSLGRGSLTARDTVGKDAPTGVFIMGQGSAQAVAGGAQTVAGARSGADLSITAGGDVALASISNPTVLALSAQDRTPRAAAHFFSYAEDASVAVNAYAGDIRVGNQALTRRSVLTTGNVPTGASEIAPPKLDLIAFTGSILTDRTRPLEGRIRIYPSAQGSLRLLAGQDVANVAFEVTDVVPDSLPQWYRAAGVQGERAPNDTQLAFGPLAARRLVTPTNESGTPFAIVAGRDVVDTEFFLPRRSRIESGRDIVNLKADLQNLEVGDISIVRAGRDMRYAPFYRNGETVADNGGYVSIGGPGRLVVQSGRDINLGVTNGIEAVGANANLALTVGQSAELTVLVGLKGEYTQTRLDAFFDVLAKVADAQSAGRKDRIDAALAEVDAAAVALFGEGQASDRGNLTMYFSKIRTEGGSGIDILVPRGTPDSLSAGNINAGLPGTGESDIGIVTVLGGDIRTYLQNSFNVNQSKVATLQGGDISIFSREGNIDAGRGARDSRTTQPPRRVPITVKDPDTGLEIETGLFAYVPPLDASGSGIRTFTSDPDGPGPLKAPKPGSVTLIAPRGFIDAGEAGVDSAGGLIVFAPTLINSQNFSSTGGSVGVPVNNAAGIGAALSAAGSSAAGATKSGDDAAKSLASQNKLSTAKIPSFITVQVVGFGDEGSRDRDDRSSGK